MRTKVNTLIRKMGCPLTLVSGKDGKKTQIYGVFGKDEESDLSETDGLAAQLITRTRTLYIHDNLLRSPAPGDSIIDKNSKIVEFTGDNVKNSGGTKYHVIKIERYSPDSSTTIAYKLELAG